MHTILIVDDENTHLCATRDYLTLSGFNVLISNSALNALLLIEKIVPDLLVLDIMMPEINGYVLIKKLQNRVYFSRIPFIFLTAKGMTQDRIKGYNLGCSGYVCKPFDPQELVAIINNVLIKDRQREDEILKTIREIKIIRSYLENQYCILHKLNLNLTDKEARVLHYLLRGFKNKEIAMALHTSIRNIEKYVTKLLNKTNTHNRTSLVRFVYLTKFNNVV